MAGSQQTFNKKEKEKAKAAKRKLKAEKREEQRSQSPQSHDDMIMYVDEFGNFTSTPPDPSKRVEINEEDIQIGATPMESIVEEIKTGKIDFYNEGKGFGFIKDEKSGDSYFFHVNSTSQPIEERMRVSFDLQKGPKGWNAVNVVVL